MNDDFKAKMARMEQEQEEWEKFDLQARLRASDALLAEADEVLAGGRQALEKSKFGEDEDEDEDVEGTRDTSSDETSSANFDADQDRGDVHGAKRTLQTEGDARTEKRARTTPSSASLRHRPSSMNQSSPQHWVMMSLKKKLPSMITAVQLSKRPP